MSGIKVSLKISGEACPVAQEGLRNDVAVKEVNKTAVGTEDSTIEEIVFEEEIDSTDDAFEELFSTDEVSVFRYDRSEELVCACDQVEKALKHPISGIQIQKDSLFITLHLGATDELQGLIERLRAEFDHVSVAKIQHSDTMEFEDTITFDKRELTERQLEVYRTAFEMGYFEHGSGTNASDIADELGIAVTTFREHINILHTKMAESFFDGELPS